ncbi:MAG TPA: elongation factor Ts, partial [Nitrospirae bacterium]|nr:elongation factor Ts [Nitrospirota bacterium]
VKDVAMHIAAANPRYLSREDIPQDVIEREKSIYRDQTKDRPEHVVEKIVEGKLEKFYAGNCLLDQIFVKDPDQKKKIRDIVTEMVSKFGENIIIRRFTRYQLGEELEN